MQRTEYKETDNINLVQSSMKSDPVWVVNLYLYSESDTLLNFKTVERRLIKIVFLIRKSLQNTVPSLCLNGIK